MKRIITVLLLTSLALAGCLQPTAEDTGSASAVEGVSDESTGPARMTADETKDVQVARCRSDSEKFCATRTVTVKGDFSGLRALDVDLDLSYANVQLKAGREGSWGMVAVHTAKGDTEEQARANLDKIVFTWKHTDGKSHFLRVESTLRSNAQTENNRVEITLPGQVWWTLSAESSYGNLDARGIRTNGLSLRSSYGNAVLDVDATNVDVSSSYGNLEAKLRPAQSGRVKVDVKYGNADLRVPEDTRRGYDAKLDVSFGKTTLSMNDGKSSSSSSEYGMSESKSFKTTDFEAREVQTPITMTGSYGNLVLSS